MPMKNALNDNLPIILATLTILGALMGFIMPAMYRMGDGLNAKMDHHFMILSADIQANSERLDKTNERLAVLEGASNSTNERLNETNERLNETNERLNETNERLNEANERLSETNERLAVLEGAFYSFIGFNHRNPGVQSPDSQSPGARNSGVQISGLQNPGAQGQGAEAPDAGQTPEP